MPERKVQIIRVDASSIQGEGAFLSLRSYTWDERKALQVRFDELPANDPLFRSKRTRQLEEEIQAHLVDWNLVDDQGKPIKVGDLGALFDNESSFVFLKMQELIRQVLGIDETTKN